MTIVTSTKEIKMSTLLSWPSYCPFSPICPTAAQRRKQNSIWPGSVVGSKPEAEMGEHRPLRFTECQERAQQFVLEKGLTWFVIEVPGCLSALPLLPRLTACRLAIPSPQPATDLLLPPPLLGVESTVFSYLLDLPNNTGVGSFQRGQEM